MTLVHRGIKSTNILLDDNCAPKLSDYEASTLIPWNHTHLLTGVHGTLGCLDPEYFQSGKLIEESDVHSYGVVQFSQRQTMMTFFSRNLL